MFIIAILQMVMHYLGIIALALGLVAYLFGNNSRGSELLLSGLTLIILKYVLGMIYLLFSRVKGKGAKNE